VRDEALIRLYANTGARLSEVAELTVDDVDLRAESVRFHGKGAKDRRGAHRSAYPPGRSPVPAGSRNVPWG
jgi:site-specific recombinase XerC